MSELQFGTRPEPGDYKLVDIEQNKDSVSKQVKKELADFIAKKTGMRPGYDLMNVITCDTLLETLLAKKIITVKDLKSNVLEAAKNSNIGSFKLK